MKQFILLFHPLSTSEEVRIDFKSEKPASDFIELTKLMVIKFINISKAISLTICRLQN